MEKKVTAEHPIVVKKIRKSLKESIREGSYASAMRGFGTSYISPYAIALNATSSQVGILSALASLFPSIVQLKASRLTEKFSRKKIAVTSALLEALMFIPIILVGILFFMGVPYTVWILIALVALLYGFGGAIYPAWFSWMGSLVPEKARGRYFSLRNKIAGFFGLITLIIGAFILDYSKKFGFVLVGFGILFALAFLARLISIRLLAKQYEPKLKIRKKDYFSFSQFLKRAPKTPFGRFVIFTSVLRIAIGIATPFWAVYMLRNLGFSYVWFMAIIVSGTLFQLSFYPILGKFSDKFGNALLLKIASAIIAIIPFLWVISPYLGLSNLGIKFYLLFVPAIFSGFAWAGFNLATNNYIYDSVRQEKRPFGSAYYNFLLGIGMFIGAGIGSLIALTNISFMNTLLFIFLVSGIARIGVFIFGAKYLKEVRHVKEFTPQFISKEFHPVQGLIREVHNFNHSEKDIEHYI